MGERAIKSKYPELNASQVIPEKFKETWEPTLNNWGNALMNAVRIISEMLAIGLDLPKNTFIEKTNYGSHLLGNFYTLM